MFTWPADFCGKNRKLNMIGLNIHTFQPDSFIPIMLIGTIDLYHFNIFIPLSVTLTLAGRSQGQCKAKPVEFIFMHTFQLNGLKFHMAIKQLELDILRQLLSVI